MQAGTLSLKKVAVLSASVIVLLVLMGLLGAFISSLISIDSDQQPQPTEPISTNKCPDTKALPPEWGNFASTLSVEGQLSSWATEGGTLITKTLLEGNRTMISFALIQGNEVFTYPSLDVRLLSSQNFSERVLMQDRFKNFFGWVQRNPSDSSIAEVERYFGCTP